MASYDVMQVSFPVADPGGDNKQIMLLRAPLDAVGGGIRLVGAYANNEAATAAGTTFTYALHKFSAAGTPAVNGTISATLGGTTDYWADGVVKPFVLDDDYTFLDAGESVWLDYQEIATGSPTLSSLVLQYVMGK